MPLAEHQIGSVERKHRRLAGPAQWIEETQKEEGGGGYLRGRPEERRREEGAVTAPKTTSAVTSHSAKRGT